MKKLWLIAILLIAIFAAGYFFFKVILPIFLFIVAVAIIVMVVKELK